MIVLPGGLVLRNGMNSRNYGPDKESGLSFSPDAGARWVSSRYGIAYAEFRSSGLEKRKKQGGINEKEEP